ncbi:cytochrome o ubiquinol oxidase operon protein cyoD [Paenibacillus sp. UNCCL117]|uniref:cytochrome o ubiquinol oxidase subunit IV n=1 Tax=unclassified Paenibacillus TaxID=185978 RepID=UPI00088A14B2|nr:MULTISPECIES: cytochrome o ubiquinol oxidase subunit IV [unclassified Paenibacillus]SDD70967.1 cytochrome o ubiquinol oxidase operon protein cyoD [Paenibacillus sp. cl123]SFW45445.1 cytochrome o ubiquinol oxidase operon protein cyoD [Paenibacillus sp. UNCCL117]
MAGSKTAQPARSGGGHQQHDAGGSHGSLKSYVIGFALSIILTIIPLVIVLGGMVNRTGTLVIILLAAILQFVVQLLFFMHVKEGPNARWNIMALILGMIILLTIVAGSIWIMTYNAVAH